MQLFSKDTLDRIDRMRILAGSPANNQQDCGKIVCSCFNVGINTLSQLIKASAITTPEQIGERLQAGTNCGSCVPELRDLITQLNAQTG
jgi:assimilatory nitrate reductase catalytic subunit